MILKKIKEYCLKADKAKKKDNNGFGNYNEDVEIKDYDKILSRTIKQLSRSIKQLKKIMMKLSSRMMSEKFNK